MEELVYTRQPVVISERFDNLSEYLENQSPIVLVEEKTADEGIEQYTDTDNVIIPPLNTDIRFSEHLPAHIPKTNEAEGHSLSHPNLILKENYVGGARAHDGYIIVPPLNTDIRFSKELPSFSSYNHEEHDHPGQFHPREKHIHENITENFSWAIPTSDDTKLDLLKKGLISKVNTQHACGSCWAVSFADTMSDCFVVSGAVSWAPNISATYMMSCIPTSSGAHNMCSGGNPAAVARILEYTEVGDKSCIDYSWCSGDSEICKSVSSARHFDAHTLASKLNKNIPKPCGCYFKDVEKYLYQLDTGSDVFSINRQNPIDIFRNTVKTHILDFGPVIGGYVVLKNFFTGNFTDPNLNGGVYLDRADYNRHRGGKLMFNDFITKEAAGLHAISIVGWGVARNIQYDNDKFGDVPYWHCRNSWGDNWGNENGFFKMAMYPFNKISQFDKQVMTEVGGPVGSMILIRATKTPKTVQLAQISKHYNDNINKQLPDSYYSSGPEKVKAHNTDTVDNIEQYSKRSTMNNTYVIIATIIVILAIWGFATFKNY